MRLDEASVKALTIGFSPRRFLRVMRAEHRANPLGVGPGHSRFSSPNDAFRLLYIAADIATAIAETIVRDRFEGRARRVLERSELDTRVMTMIGAKDPLALLDLRGAGLLRLGVSTDAARAKAHGDGQSLSQTLHETTTLDGVIYASRLTSRTCVAIYDRAIVKLSASEAADLVRHPDLMKALEALNVSIDAA